VHRAWDTSQMGYMLGSEAESMVFTDDGIGYEPAGLWHAVDLESAANGPDAVLAYATCGHAVRVCPDTPFEPGADGVHEGCAARARGD